MLLFPRGRELDEVFREEQIETPVERNTTFLFQSREFAEVNCSPQPPGDETRKVKSEHLSDAGAFANRRELTQCGKYEWFLRAVAKACMDVAGKNAALSQRVLCRRRIWVSG